MNRAEGINRSQGGRGSAAPGGSDTGSSFAQRASGATAGTTSRGGQPVFASAGAAKGKAASSDKSRAAANTPSTRSAAGDLWSGFKPAQRASVLQASAAPQPDGMSGTVVAALALLGLGLTGIAGAMAFVVLRTRRAKAASGK